ncbi:MAG: hypothetical protein AAF495_00815 [Pseudomonadota bacterium]
MAKVSGKVGRATGAAEQLFGRFRSGPDALAEALDATALNDGAAVPLLGPEECAHFLNACDALTYRVATPKLGQPGREVFQDFELTVDFPEDSPLFDLAKALELWLEAALATMSDPPLAGPVPMNDLIVQRYHPGSRGITPHRDHITYRNLVILVSLSGRCRFFLCEDRSGAGRREIPMEAGSALLMRAPGFAGREDRPFHMLCDVTEHRVGLGYRHEVPR